MLVKACTIFFCCAFAAGLTVVDKKETNGVHLQRNQELWSGELQGEDCTCHLGDKCCCWPGWECCNTPGRCCCRQSDNVTLPKHSLYTFQSENKPLSKPLSIPPVLDSGKLSQTPDKVSSFSHNDSLVGPHSSDCRFAVFQDCMARDTCISNCQNLGAPYWCWLPFNGACECTSCDFCRCSIAPGCSCRRSTTTTTCPSGQCLCSNNGSNCGGPKSCEDRKTCELVSICCW